MTYLYRLSQGDKITLFTHYIHFFTKNPGDLTGLSGGFTPAHLWFIAYLFLYSLIGVPLFLMLNRQDKFLTKLSGFLSGRLCLLLLIIPLSSAAAISLLEDKNPFVYFLFFLYGYLIFTKEDYQKAINRDLLSYLILGIVFEIIIYGFPNEFAEWSFPWILYEIMKTANRLVWVFVWLGIGNKFLNRPSKVLAYLSRSSFPVYILHLPINTLVGYFIVKLNMGIYAKGTIIIFLTTVLSFAAYEVIYRIQPLCFLMGIKKTNKQFIRDRN
jgi:peptidoglycan/LPS O-acetylase OafA/YrhL